MTIWQALAVMWSGAIMVSAGVALGGILVYRTKRESHETMFPGKPVEATGPVNVDDMFDDIPDADDDPLQEVAVIQNAKFLSQLAKNTKEQKESTTNE